MVYGLIDWLRYGFLAKRRVVPQTISYVENDERKSIPTMSYPLAGSFVFSPYSVLLELENGYVWWEGDVYVFGQAMPESRLGGSGITLSEKAVSAINEAEVTEIEIRNIRNGNTYRTVDTPDPLTIRLW